MASVYWRSFVGLILLAGGQSAFGGTYVDPSGFSFTYSDDGWVLLTHGDVNQLVPRDVKNWISRSNVDLNRVAVVLVRNGGSDEFLENLNVVVQSQQIPTDDNAVKTLTAPIVQKYQSLGVKIDNLQGRVQRVGSYDAVVLEYQAQGMPGVSDTLRQKQVMFPGGGKTYIVTCTTTANSFDKYQPAFDRVLTSVQLAAPVTQGFNWNRVVLTGVVGAIVGGFVGGLTWFARKVSSKAGQNS